MASTANSANATQVFLLADIFVEREVRAGAIDAAELREGNEECILCVVDMRLVELERRESGDLQISLGEQRLDFILRHVGQRRVLHKNVVRFADGGAAGSTLKVDRDKPVAFPDPRYEPAWRELGIPVGR